MIIVNESNKFRKFSKIDYDMYSGATKSSNGKYPQIADVGDYTIIISPNEDNPNKFVISTITPKGFEYYREFPNERAAIRVANDLANGTEGYISDVIETWKHRY